MTRYVVQSTDTLWWLAVRFLGDGNRWPEIQSYNQLSGTTIYPGQELLIPPKAPVVPSTGPEPSGSTSPTPPSGSASQPATSGGTSTFEPATPAPAGSVNVPGTSPVSTVQATPGLTDKLKIDALPSGGLSLSCLGPMSEQVNGRAQPCTYVRLRFTNVRTGEQVDVLTDHRAQFRSWSKSAQITVVTTRNGRRTEETQTRSYSTPKDVDLPGIPGDSFRVEMSRPYTSTNVLEDVNSPALTSSFRQVGFIASSGSAGAPSAVPKGPVKRPPMLWLPALQHYALPPGTRGNGKRAIILHETGPAFDAVRAAKSFADSAGPQVPPSATHVIGRNGEIVECVKNRETGWHVGRDSRIIHPDGTRETGINGFAYGFEIVNDDNRLDPWTDAQYRSVAWLTAYFMQEDGITFDAIYTHAGVAAYGERTDPNAPNFSFARLRQEVDAVVANAQALALKESQGATVDWTELGRPATAPTT